MLLLFWKDRLPCLYWFLSTFWLYCCTSAGTWMDLVVWSFLVLTPKLVIVIVLFSSVLARLVPRSLLINFCRSKKKNHSLLKTTIASKPHKTRSVSMLLLLSYSINFEAAGCDKCNNFMSVVQVAVAQSD
jgi:hypothetical protein